MLSDLEEGTITITVNTAAADPVIRDVAGNDFATNADFSFKYDITDPVLDDPFIVTGAAGTDIDDNGHYNGDEGTAEDVAVVFNWADGDATGDISNFDRTDFNLSDIAVSINGTSWFGTSSVAVSYTHLRAHETLR